MSLRFLACVLCASTAAAAARSEPAPRDYDVVIYGGTSASVTAAIQTAKMGKSVCIVEPGRHLGGLTSGGLGWTDSGNKSVIGGLSREFYRRVKQHYDQPSAWKFEKPGDYGRYRPKDDAQWTFEPSVAEKILRSWLAEHRVPVFYGQRLNRKSGVSKRGGRILSITTETGRAYAGRLFLDCTYEGDLMAAAGVSYAVGREPNAKYGETLNGVGTRWNTHNHRFLKQVDPYVKPGEKSSGLLPGIDPMGPGTEGAGDHRVQTYNYRLCITDVKANQIPFAKPSGYNSREYELLLRNFEAGDLRLPLKIDMLPNRKTDVNNNCAVSTDFIGRNDDYPDGDYATRARIAREHEVYTRGLMWTLANHPRVPERIRNRMSRWGWAKDEFLDNDHFPHQMYIREARRMISDYVMTERDCRRLRKTPESVGMGSYNMDSHNVQRYVTPSGYVQNEGDVQESPGGAYQISYRALRPKKSECANLLVPVCVSSSHAAYGSIRMEPVFMVLGQSAATAGCQALDQKVAVQDVDVEKLLERLKADGQVLDYQGRSSATGIDPKSLKGIVIDDRNAKLTGTWLSSRSIGGFIGDRYLHDNNSEKGRAQAVFTTKITTAGRYEIRLAYTANPNRASNVPVTVILPDGKRTVTVNQKKRPPGGSFVTLGTHKLPPGATVQVVVSNADTNGHVIVDAVQILPK